MSTRVLVLSLCVAALLVAAGCGRSRPPASKTTAVELANEGGDVQLPPDAPPPKVTTPPAATAPAVPARPAAPVSASPSFTVLPPGQDPAAAAALQNYREVRAKQLEAIQRENGQRAVQLRTQPENQENRDGE